MWLSANVNSSPSLGNPATSEECARVIDQNVDTLLLVGDLSRHSFHLGEACEIRKYMEWATPGALLRSRARIASPRVLSRATKTIRAPFLGVFPWLPLQCRTCRP
ncbi:MAG TPA: hypothetical protein VI009_16835, partial [Xanthobacteraceae bacterium]